MNNETKNFTVYKSSAGSGKTYTLVKEYLSIALGAEKPQRLKLILAITFTNKAAAEMKERIVQGLAEFASGNILKNKGMFDQLCDEQSIEPALLIERAEGALSFILHHYSDFAVSTIDKFNHKIIRAFAYDLRLPLNFEVETDIVKIITSAVELLLEKAGENEALTNVLVSFLEEKLDDEKGWNLQNELVAFGMQLFNDNNNAKLEALKSVSISQFLEINQLLNQQIQSFKATIVNYGKQLLNIVTNTGLDYENFAGGKNGIVKYMQYLAYYDFTKVIPTNTVEKYFSSGKLASGKASKANQQIIEDVSNELMNIYERAKNYINSKYNSLKIYSIVKTNLYSLALLNELEKLVQEIKLDQNIVLISEFNKIISGAIANEPAPYIYERLGERYRNFLIDEFQDTSVLQWQNILPLLDNALSQGFFCMIVGDGKQSIYRWRNGEVEQFTQLPQIYSPNPKTILIKQREDSLIRNYQEKFLENNFRSKKEIVDFNNQFFEYITSVESAHNFSSVYHHHAQNFNPKNTGGTVTMDFFEGEKEERNNWMMQSVLDKINVLLDNEYELSDIAILTRTNSESSAVAAFLLENNIDVISKESLLLSSSAEVRFVVSFLKFLNNTDDEISICAVVLYLQGYMHFEQINGEKGYTYSGLIDFLNANGVNFSTDNLLMLPLYELLEKVYILFQLHTKQSPYLFFFKDYAYEFGLTDNSLSNFIDWWQEKQEKLSLTVADGIKGINLLTIHKSKGLEFPVVIVPFADLMIGSMGVKHWVDTEEHIENLKYGIVNHNAQMLGTPFENDYMEEVRKMLLDQINMLYVAFTRPREHLFILSGNRGRSMGQYLKGFVNANIISSNNENSFAVGELKSKSKNDGKLKKTNIADTPQVSNKWKDNLKIFPENRIEGIETNKQRLFGTFVHSLLSELIFVDDIDSILSKHAKTIESNHFKIDEIRSILQNIVKHETIAEFYTKDYQVKTEVNLLDIDGRIYRPDRLLLKGSKAWVIDYKTGIHIKENVEQVQRYCALLSQMNYKLQKAYLIYTETNEVKEIDNVKN